jgi:hypothetical protein
MVLAVLAAIIALFYAGEDWRGRRAWENYAREMEAKGQPLNLSAYIGAPVPDEQNAFKAPKMADWFDRGSLRILYPSSIPATIAQITVLPPSTNRIANAGEADFVLRYVSPGMAVFSREDGKAANAALSDVTFDDIELGAGIQALAREARLNITFAPQAEALLRQTVTLRWRQITALEALSALLNNYGLQLTKDGNAPLSLITAKAPESPRSLVGLPGPAENPSDATNSPTAGLKDGEATLAIVKFDNVDLGEAIKALARQEGLRPVIAPQAQARLTQSVTAKWSNITARQALQALLDNYGLQWREDSKAGVAHIALKATIPVKAAGSSALRQQIETAFHNADGPMTEGVLGIPFLARPVAEIKPVRIVLVAEPMPKSNELADVFGGFFPEATSSGMPGVLQVGSTGTNTFSLILKAANAGDYLASNDRLEPDFDTMREALARPQAQMGDDFSSSAAGPDPIGSIPNFVNLRIVSQALAQRAQCCLLLGQPDKALRQVTLIRQLCRLLESPPARHPPNLLTAMMHAALTGLYVGMVAEGLRNHAWQEPQLAALEPQLQQINLLPRASKAFQGQRAWECHWLEGTPVSQLEDPVQWPPKTNFWGRTERFLIYTLGPRGWVYQNMVWRAKLLQPLIDSVDLTRGLIVPHQLEQISQTLANHFEQGKTLAAQGKLSAASAEFSRAIRTRFSPYTYLAVRYFGDFRRAVRTVAQNQTLASQTLIACALERYRLARHEYPETLEALSPQFIQNIPPDLIGGRPLRYRRGNDGTFILYSIGWNEKDDGGVGRWADDQGDWVWDARL